MTEEPMGSPDWFVQLKYRVAEDFWRWVETEVFNNTDPDKLTALKRQQVRAAIIAEVRRQLKGNSDD